MVVSFVVNGEARTVEADADTPLLWVLRENLGLTGTKFGCGIAVCGSCTVHIDGAAVRACAVPVSAVEGAAVRTIEGLAGKDSPHAVQAAWIANQVPQCGYCQSGMIMAVSALLARTATPTDVEIETQITNICRCGTYERVRRAIRSLVPAGEVSHG
ncbi:MAG: (2Fe-2S)-binding protein [Steroidobacteraceae bacterium]